MMKSPCLIAFLLGFSASAAPPVTYSIATVDGKTVQVTEAALKATYSAYVQSAVNTTYENEDGSTSIIRPSVMVAGEAHAVASIAGSNDDFAAGLCKVKGFAALESSEGDGNAPAPGPTVILNEDGTVASTNEGPVGNVYAFRSITCRKF
jgi:hypothetical protein